MGDRDRADLRELLREADWENFKGSVLDTVRHSFYSLFNSTANRGGS